MASTNKIFNFLISLLSLLILFALISKIFKGIKANRNTDIVSDEGKDILNDPEKLKKLQAAVDQYHKNGNWDGLKSLKT